MKKMLSMLLMALVAIGAWSCDKEPDAKPVAKPTIGINEPEFDAATMSVKVMIAPSTDATAWYWSVAGGDNTGEFNKEEGAAAREISFDAIYGVEYIIKAYAENKGGQSDTVEKRFVAMPDGEVTLTIGEVTLNEETGLVEATIYPSELTTEWYWCYDFKDIEGYEVNWIGEIGNQETTVSFEYSVDEVMIIRAYATCGEIRGEEVSRECFFELPLPSLIVSKPLFDSETMMVSFDVKPSENTHYWYWSHTDHIDITEIARYDDAEARTVSFEVEYDTPYHFVFRSANIIGQEYELIVDFTTIGPLVDIAISNLTAYSLDTAITMKDNCVQYVAGAMHTSAYDESLFIEEAESSLNPDSSYPFAIFNSASEDRIFSEQDLVRNSRIDSDDNAGIMLIPGTSYTIAVYGIDQNDNYSVTTTEVVIPEAVIDGDLDISVAATNITETSADATVVAEAPCKFIVGLVDPAVAAADSENPFNFEGASDDEIKLHFATTTHAIPMVYSGECTIPLGNNLKVGHEYYLYVIAISNGKIGQVNYTTFSTVRPSLTGTSKITAATIEAQTSHELLTVKLTTDSGAQKVRVYAAPTVDHAAYADNLEYVLDADTYQNYREEYEVVDGIATANIAIYHPGDNYYIYASAVDAEGLAGEMVCVSRLSGLDSDYYTTIEEIVDEGNLSYNGTGSATLTAQITGQEGTRQSVTLVATEFSSNVDKVWFFRISDTVENIEDRIKSNLAEYPTIYGSYKSVREGWSYKYIDDTNNSFDPKYEALEVYDEQWGGDIIVMVILDTDGKARIDSYYAAGLGVCEM